MPTEKLYYRDSFLTEFDARVLRQEHVGEVFHVVLDRTAFYPTGGGQPHDTGFLDDCEVVEVQENDAEEVVHVLRSELRPRAAAPLSGVRGRIDVERRRDHMQQHSGQHILSAAFVQVCNALTVSFHLGAETSAIDLAHPSLTPTLVREVVQLSNRITLEDRPVRVLNVTREEAERMNLRKETEREGVLRIIDIENFDRTPCGGTHVTRTGQVGNILVRKVEKYKQGFRVEFVCGDRARRLAESDFDTLTQAARLFSCAFNDVPTMIEKQIEEAKAARREKEELHDRLARLEAEKLVAQAPTVGKFRVIVRIPPSGTADFDYLKRLAQELSAQSQVVALLVSQVIPPGGTKAGVRVVLAVSADSALDANALLREGFAQCDPAARGGGGKTVAQGNLSDASRVSALVEFVKERLQRA